ncbi:Transcriptional regulatory protein, C terminal [Cedecea neteri]|uniref:Transcriptional regulatory protein, C terminal n=1 Tax=Cedecea neteri TaxID=158822 RepID=A0A291E6C1_9ENTR|nr:winged helix-turn-helix domain-containing protein [Cedecea neteri]ATF95449.1 winged helix family transcriptional regulator [Cedecea neteri]SQC92128.1 Transcriptional regulatory protein, C terminal [Cedecea neteri]
MQYSVDNKIIVTQSGITTPDDESTQFIISAVPLRLLTYFVKNSNRLITREEIYYHVWEMHDLTPSGTALATQMSYLRKILSSYGLGDDVLITKPKLGFIFNATITQTTGISETIHNEIEEENEEIKEKKNYNNTICYIVIFCAVLTTIAYLLFFKTEKESDINWHTLNTIKGCHVYIMNPDISQTVSMYYQKKAYEFITKNGLRCDADDMVLINIQHPDTNGHDNVYETKQFYSYCKKMKENYICDNTYFSAGKID